MMIIHIWILWIVMSICLLSHFASTKPRWSWWAACSNRAVLETKEVRWFLLLGNIFSKWRATKKNDKLENFLEWSFVLLEYVLCQRKGWVLQFVATQIYTHAVGVPPAMLGPHHLLKFPHHFPRFHDGKKERKMTNKISWLWLT